MTGRTLTLSALVALAQAKAIVTNHCSEVIYIWSIPHVGSSNVENLPINPGGRYEEPWRYGTDENPGIAIKISSQSDGIYNGGDEIDFAYTVEHSNSSKVWIDLSRVRGQAFDNNFGFFGCDGQFSASMPEIDTQPCDARQNLELVLCGSERSSSQYDSAPMDTINGCCGNQHVYQAPVPVCSNCTMSCCAEFVDENHYYKPPCGSGCESCHNSHGNYHSCSDSDSDSDSDSGSDSNSGSCMYGYGHPKCTNSTTQKPYPKPHQPYQGYSTPYTLPPQVYSSPLTHPSEGYSTPVTQYHYSTPQTTHNGCPPPTYNGSSAMCTSNEHYVPPVNTSKHYAPPQATSIGHYLPPPHAEKNHTPRKPAGEDGSPPREVVGYNPSPENTDKHHHYHHPGPAPANYPPPQPTWAGSNYPHPIPAYPEPKYSQPGPVPAKPNYSPPKYGPNGQWYYPSSYHNGGSQYAPGYYNGVSYYSRPVPSGYVSQHPAYPSPKWTPAQPYTLPHSSPYSRPMPTAKPYPVPVSPTGTYQSPTAKPYPMPVGPTGTYQSPTGNSYLMPVGPTGTYQPPTTKPYPIPVGPTGKYQSPMTAPHYPVPTSKGKTCCPKACCHNVPVTSQCSAKVVYPWRRATLSGDKNSTLVQLKPRTTFPLTAVLNEEVAKRVNATKTVGKGPSPSPLCDLVLQYFPKKIDCDEQALEVYAREIYPHLCESEPHPSFSEFDCEQVKVELKKAFPNVDKPLQLPASKATHHAISA